MMIKIEFKVDELIGDDHTDKCTNCHRNNLFIFIGRHLFRAFYNFSLRKTLDESACKCSIIVACLVTSIKSIVSCEFVFLKMV